MLFYQRTSSIQGMEQQFKHADPLNPIRLENPSPIQQYIKKENELFLRSYCAQDPVHAKFVRKVLERLWETGQEQCTEEHEVEDRTLQLALSYVHNISSRWKNQPEMDGTVKLIHKYCQRCTTCALTVLQFLAGDQVMVESLVKSPYQATRKAFSYMLRSSLSALHPTVVGDRGAEVAQLYYANLVTVVRHLARAWELVARTTRAWTEYFGLLADLVDLGVEEARLVLDEDFIEYCAELIHVHFIEKHDFRADVKLKQRYAAYLSARERNRPFNHYALMHFFARMVFRLDLTIWPNGDDRVLQAGSEQIGPTPTELDYLGLSGSPYNLEWLKRIIAGRTAPAVADGIVGYLASARPLAGAVSHILVQGLDHKSMPVAAAFLQPTVMFCTTCGNLNQIVDLVVKFAESVPTIGLEYGKEYCLTVKSLLRAENKGLGLESGFLRDVLAEQMHQWAPVLLVADSDVAVDVRGDALDIVNVLLLDRLEAMQGEDPSEYRVFQARALQLAKQAADYVQSTILNSNSNESHNLQPGHANQVMQAVDRCLGSAELDNVEDEQLVEEIQRVMVELKGKADQAVETLSTAEWQESSEMDALSEDFEDLVSP
jgi:Domain of unknown function (DUF3517)